MQGRGRTAGAGRAPRVRLHGVLSGPAASRIKASKLTELVILDTILLSKECEVVYFVVDVSFYRCSYLRRPRARIFIHIVITWYLVSFV